MTIIFILTLGVIVGITLQIFSSTTFKTTDQYLLKQAQLLAQSAIEYTIMAVQGHQISTNCVRKVSLRYNNTFDINVSIRYIGKNIPNNCPLLYNNLEYNESNLTMLMYVDVTLNPTVQKDAPKFHYTTISLQKL